MAAIPELGQVGIFAEPAGAAAYAGLKKAIRQDVVSGDDAVLVLNTGSGLKDVNAALASVSPALIIEPTLSAVEKALK
jgi:threonine synthase